MKTSRAVLLLLALALLLVPALVAGLWVTRQENERQGQLSRAALTSGLQSEFQQHWSAQPGLRALLSGGDQSEFVTVVANKGHSVLTGRMKHFGPKRFLRLVFWLKDDLNLPNYDVDDPPRARSISWDPESERETDHAAEHQVLEDWQSDRERADYLFNVRHDLAAAYAQANKLREYEERYYHYHGGRGLMPDLSADHCFASLFGVGAGSEVAAEENGRDGVKFGVRVAGGIREKFDTPWDWSDWSNAELNLIAAQSAKQDLRQWLSRISEFLEERWLLPPQAWIAIRHEIDQVRAAANDATLPLGPDDWRRFEAQRDDDLAIVAECVAEMRRTGREVGFIAGRQLDFAPAQVDASSSSGRDEPLTPYWTIKREALQQALFPRPFLFAGAGLPMDLSEYQLLLSEDQLNAAPADYLAKFRLASLVDGDPPPRYYVALRREALDAVLAQANPGGGAWRGWIYGGFAALCALGLALLVFVLWRERRLQAMRAQVVSNVSHELKTPVALMRLYSESLLLNRIPEPEKQKDYLRVITQESQRLSGLVNNILDFSRLERGKQNKWEFTDFDWALSIDKVLNAFGGLAGREGVKLEFHCGERPFLIHGDEAALSQVVFNLVDNAVKYAGKNVQPVLLELERGERVRLKVSDHGPGIPKEEWEQVFEPFVRSGDPLTQARSGAGLGLTLVRHTVKAHGGRVFIQETPGGGATFVVELPRAGKV